MGGAQIVGSTRDLRKPWDFFYFTYVQKYVQYDPGGYKDTNIPGVAIRLPKKVRFANRQGFVECGGMTRAARAMFETSAWSGCQSAGHGTTWNVRAMASPQARRREAFTERHPW